MRKHTITNKKPDGKKCYVVAANRYMFFNRTAANTAFRTWTVPKRSVADATLRE